MSKRDAYRRTELPYGLWTCADGREVLFNRHYQPIWQRHQGHVMPAMRGEWVKFVSQRWFYNDSTCRKASTRQRLNSVLAAFQNGQDVRQWLQS